MALAAGVHRATTESFRYMLLRSGTHQQIPGDAGPAHEPFDSVFRAYFRNWPRITASYEERECGVAIELAATAATRASMNIVLGDFLIRLNRAGRRFSLPMQAQDQASRNEKRPRGRDL
jgi:hypothetical protein